MITITTSNLNVSNDRLIPIKVPEELFYTLTNLGKGIEEVCERAGIDTASINRSLIIKNLIELGLRSDHNILRIDRHNWSPKDILLQQYPNYESIECLKDLNIDIEQQMNAIIRVEAEFCMRTMKDLSVQDVDILEDICDSDDSLKCPSKEMEINTRFQELIYQLYKDIGKSEEITEFLLKKLIVSKEYGVIGLYQAIDTYKYNVLLKELKLLIEKHVLERMGLEKTPKVNKRLPKKKLVRLKPNE